jgi:hypothetical protein
MEKKVNNELSMDYQVNRLGLCCVAVVIVAGVAAMFLPLDAPAAYDAEHGERIAWLNANRGSFIAGWVNQIAAMLTLSGVFFAIAWQIRRRNGLRAILAAMVTLMSVMAFIIPKFIAVWSIPLLAETAASGAVGAQMSDSLLLLLNVSIPFSLYTSFDYLGFWLYAVFALLVAGPLYGESMSSKTTAVTLGAFGLIYQGMLIVLLVGGIGATDIHRYFVGASMLLLIVVIAAAFVFKSAMANAQGGAE